MIFDYVDTAKGDNLVILCAEPVQLNPKPKLRVQLGLKGFLACVCLSQGLRLMDAGDPIGMMTGLALLVCVPSCCYLGWRDYAALKAAPNGRPLHRTRELREIVR